MAGKRRGGKRDGAKGFDGISVELILLVTASKQAEEKLTHLTDLHDGYLTDPARMAGRLHVHWAGVWFAVGKVVEFVRKVRYLPFNSRRPTRSYACQSVYEGDIGRR